MKWKILGLTVAVLAVVGFGFDGPFWLFTTPPRVDSPVRWAIAELHSWSGATRATAADHLRFMGAAAAPAAPTLVEHLDDFGWSDGWASGFSKSLSFHGGPHFVMLHAGEALSSIGVPAVPSLISGLQHGRDGVRSFAAELLGGMSDARALPALRAALERDASSRVQMSVVRTLGRIGDREAFGIVVHQLHEGDPARRAIAAILLGDFHSPEAAAALQSALADPVANVRECAAEALKRMKR